MRRLSILFFILAVMAIASANQIDSYSPPYSNVYTTDEANVTFSITLNQSATVYWYLDGSLVKTETAKTSSYINSSPSLGSHNVTAISGNLSQTWTWNVSNGTYMNFTMVEGGVFTGFTDVLGISTIGVAIVFVFLGILCSAGKLSVSESLIVFVPTIWGYTEVTVNFVPMWFRALIVIVVSLVWWMTLIRIIGER